MAAFNPTPRYPTPLPLSRIVRSRKRFSASSTFSDLSDSALSRFAAARSISMGAPRPAATGLRWHQPARLSARPASQHIRRCSQQVHHTLQKAPLFWGGCSNVFGVYLL